MTTTVRSSVVSVGESNGIPPLPFLSTPKRQQLPIRRADELQNSILGKDAKEEEINYGLNDILPEDPRRIIKRSSITDEDEMDNRVPSNLDLILLPKVTRERNRKSRRRFKKPVQPQFKSSPTIKPPPVRIDYYPLTIPIFLNWIGLCLVGR